jgi:ankyrin repeat protein
MFEASSGVLFILSLAFSGILTLILLIFLRYALIDRQQNPKRIRTIFKVIICQLIVCCGSTLFFKIGMDQQTYTETLCGMVSSRDFAGVEKRLRDGQDVNSCFTEQSQSVLDLAIENKDEKMISLLRKYGAKRNNPDYNDPQ